MPCQPSRLIAARARWLRCAAPDGRFAEARFARDCCDPPAGELGR